MHHKPRAAAQQLGQRHAGKRARSHVAGVVRADVDARKAHGTGQRSLPPRLKRIDLGPYAAWTEPERLLFNVERAYREFRGLPYDAPIDALATFRGMHALRTHFESRAH